MKYFRAADWRVAAEASALLLPLEGVHLRLELLDAPLLRSVRCI